MKKILSLVFIMVLALQIHAQWVQTKGPYEGFIFSLAVQDDSSGSRTLFAGTEGGIYISTDDGSSWTRSDFWIPEYYSIYTIAVNDTFVFASTGDGIYRSSDKGISWSKAEPGLPDGAKAFAISSNKIFAVSNDKVYISTDNGTNWKLASSGLPQFISTLTVLGTNVFAGTYFNGIYRSADNGADWTQVNSDLTKETKIYDFAVSGTNLFAGAMQGIFHSTDNGNNWTRADSGIPKDTWGLRNIYCMAVSGMNIYAGVSHPFSEQRGIYLSTDNGNSWRNISPDLSVGSLVPCGKYIFAVSWYNLYRTSDNGENWIEPSSGFIYPFIINLLINGDNLYAATRQGIHLSTNNGESWSKVGSEPPLSEITTLAVCGSRLLAGGYFKDSYDMVHALSFFNGTEWIKADSGLPVGSYVRDLEVMGDVFFATVGLRDFDYASGIFVSKDSGASWSESSHDLTEIKDIAICGTDIFAASKDGIYVSSDSAKSWSLAFYPGPVSSLSIAGSDIFAGTGEHGVYIYHSSDKGKSWSRANTKESQMDYFSAFEENGNTVLIGMRQGRVFITDNYCKSWTDITAGLPGVSSPYWKINTLTGRAGYIFAGTTLGVWRHPLSKAVAEVENSPEAPVKFSLEQNYPNPFNPTTTIKFTLPYPSHASLRIFDLLGSEVASLVNEEKSAGVHNAVWMADNIPSGIYFYEIRAGSFIQIRKMILLR